MTDFKNYRRSQIASEIQRLRGEVERLEQLLAASAYLQGE